MARGPLDLWNEWATQILVLLSFTLQLMLLLLAGIRRREAPAVLRVLLWLAYQLADSTAIYAIGHLSLGGTPRDHQLVAFWAPFLLLHLGGPDNITAYSLEDSKLWLRHLLTVVVQVLGAAYVLYKHFIGSGRGNNSLLLASILMFAIGVVKYGERTWALRCGNIETIRDSLRKEPRTKCHFYLEDRPQAQQRSFKVAEADEEEFLVRSAHALFHICKLAVVDDYSVDVVVDTRDGNTLSHLTNEEKYAVMEMELSLMYDILYTKAGVIHTFPGYCIRVVSPLATAGALLIFQFSGKAGQNRIDVAITYLLLAGAFLLEVTSLLRTIGSSWVLNFLSTTRWSWLLHEALCNGRWDRLRRSIVSLRHISNIMGISRYCISSRRWSSQSMGQYNMLHFCTSRATSYNRPLLGRLANMLGQEDWWETNHYSGTLDIPDKVKESVFTHIDWIFKRNGFNTLGIIRSDWGQQAMKRFGWELDRKHLGTEFQEGIIIWHISTELLLIRSKRAKDQDTEHIVKAIKAISNYMMFLLVDRPDMLPGLAQKRLYEQSWKFLYEEIWPKVIDDPTYHHPSRNVCTMLKELFRLRDNPNSDSWRPQGEKLASKLLEVWRNYVDETGLIWKTEASRVIYAIQLTEKLIWEEKKSGRSLQLLLGMWTDFLVYAANRCSRESHARKLNSGGALTTVLWLLTEHLSQVRSIH